MSIAKLVRCQKIDVVGFSCSPLSILLVKITAVVVQRNRYNQRFGGFQVKQKPSGAFFAKTTETAGAKSWII